MSGKDEKPMLLESAKWTGSFEKMVKDIGEQCRGYKWMFIRSAMTMSRRFDVLMYITIALGPMVGILTTLKNILESDNKAFDILAIVFAFLAGVVASIVKYSNLSEKTHTYRKTAARFASLEFNIRTQLSAVRDARLQPRPYVKWVTSVFDDLYASMPLLPETIFDKWNQFAKKSLIANARSIESEVDVDKELKQRQVSNMNKIEVNTTPSMSTSGSEDEQKENIVVVKRRHPRNCHMAITLPELNRFSNPKMEYEFHRFMGLS